jgi:plasmid maintenance system antidote protein VapI
MYRNARAEMMRAGLTCEKVSKIMNVRTATVSNWLTGRNAITVKNAVKFKKVVKSELPLEVLFEPFPEAS